MFEVLAEEKVRKLLWHGHNFHYNHQLPRLEEILYNETRK
ncbi:protein of unknown function [Xenorhabdus poinarii G6]|uniref:Uncharacterized protein n=1 Tax=Xenorhabdus poinarii G6 TaxID=1354304 RepID=A0A068R0W6_9GAMM|nr:protein of unknown function [Xenorhabdus poinarii G6]